jgi:hypothetical protein
MPVNHARAPAERVVYTILSGWPHILQLSSGFLPHLCSCLAVTNPPLRACMVSLRCLGVVPAGRRMNALLVGPSTIGSI